MSEARRASRHEAEQRRRHRRVQEAESVLPSTSSTGTLPRRDRARNQSGSLARSTCLRSNGIPFSVQHDGSSVNVRAERVAEQLESRDLLRPQGARR
jgi:hypothetical protein